jgi:hypothetical protein
MGFSMRNILAVLLATLLLSGCGLLAEGAAMEGAEAGMASEGAIGAGGLGDASIAAGATSGITAVSVSGDLAGIAEEQGVISTWLEKFADSGKTASLDGSGLLRANNMTLGRFGSDGFFRAADGRGVNGYAGYLNASDGMLYEYVNGTAQPVATLDGFVSENGVQLENVNGSTSFDVLRPGVMVRVVGVQNGFYRVVLPNGITGAIPISAAALTVLALSQAGSQCSENQPGAVVLKSGEEIAFDQCKQEDGAVLLHTPTGNVLIDTADLDRFLTGDKIPNAPLFASNALDGQPAVSTQSDQSNQTTDAANASSDNNQSSDADQSSSASDDSSGSQTQTIYILSQQTYLWAQPDAHYRPINTLYAGVKIESVGEVQNGWMQVWVLSPSDSSREVGGYGPVSSMVVAQN